MASERFKMIGAVHLILIRDGRALLARRFNTGWSDGLYGLVAGHMDGNEKASEAMIREAYEEAGIKISPEDLQIAHIMHKKLDDERVDFFFTAQKWEGEPQNTEPHRCDHMDWFPLDNIPGNTIPYCKAALENYLKGIQYSEYGWQQ